MYAVKFNLRKIQLAEKPPNILASQPFFEQKSAYKSL